MTQTFNHGCPDPRPQLSGRALQGTGPDDRHPDSARERALLNSYQLWALDVLRARGWTCTPYANWIHVEGQGQVMAAEEVRALCATADG